MTSKKEVEIKRGKSLFGGDHGGPGAPWEGDLGGGIMDYELEAVYLDTPMGQRPGEYMYIHIYICTYIYIYTDIYIFFYVYT